MLGGTFSYASFHYNYSKVSGQNSIVKVITELRKNSYEFLTQLDHVPSSVSSTSLNIEKPFGSSKTISSLDIDSDGDGVTDAREAVDGTNPDDLCSYFYWRVTVTPSDDWNAADCDGDGVTNGTEINDGTDGTNACNFELNSQVPGTQSTEWLALDCDGDGVLNSAEVDDDTDFTNSCDYKAEHITGEQGGRWDNADCDGDGVSNGREILDGTDRADPCSVNPNNQDVAFSDEWKNADCDGDGVANFTEYLVDYTNPFTPCSYNSEKVTLIQGGAWLTADCDADGLANGVDPDPLIPLPVTLVSFNAKVTGEGNQLTWTTSSEVNFDKFSIEKSINPKKGFIQISTVAGALGSYQYTDSSITKGNNYYRLKMLDLDGSFAYSRIVSVYHEYGADEHVVFPNPATGHTIYIKNYFDIQAYQLYDETGHQVKVELNKEASQYRFKIDRNAKPGVYLLKYNVNNQSIVRKVVLLN